MLAQNRFKMLTQSNPDESKRLIKEAQVDLEERLLLYQFLASQDSEPAVKPEEGTAK